MSLVPKHLHAPRPVPAGSAAHRQNGQPLSYSQEQKMEKYKQLQQLETSGQLTKKELSMMLELEQGLSNDKEVIIQFGTSEDGDTSRDTISRKSFQDDDDDDSDDDDDHPISRLQSACSNFFATYGKLIAKGTAYLFFIGFTIYLGFAISYDVKMATALLVLTGLVILALIYTLIRDHFGETIYENCLKPMGDIWDKYFHITKW